MIASFHCVGSVDVMTLGLKIILRGTSGCSAISFRMLGLIT